MITLKYSEKNVPIQCIMTQSTCYKGTAKLGKVLGVLWHSTGANNPNVKRYVQPDDKAVNRSSLLSKIGQNLNKNDWNHISVQAGVNAFIGKLADGSVATVQTLPWNYKPWGCGAGKKGSCNNGWIQFEICEDALSDASYFYSVYQEACELTAYLCKLYNIDPNGSVTYNGVKVPTILCHNDSYKLGLGSNHADVTHWFPKFGKSMASVREDVNKLLKGNAAAAQPVNNNIAVGSVVKISSDAEYYNGGQIPGWIKQKNWIVKSVSGNRVVIDKSQDQKNSIMSPIHAKYLTVVGNTTGSNTSFISYKVRVTIGALNIRSGAGTNYKIVGKIKDKGIYTIVEEKSGAGAKKWGKLKSNTGWIALDYCKKI